MCRDGHNNKQLPTFGVVELSLLYYRDICFLLIMCAFPNGNKEFGGGGVSKLKVLMIGGVLVLFTFRLKL